MSKAQQTRQSIESTEKLLNKEVLPKTAELYSHVKEFHNTEIKEYDGMIVQIDEVQEIFRNKMDECQGYLNDIRNKKTKNNQFSQKGHGFLEAKNQQIKTKVKNIEAVTSGIKETVSKIKPQKLKKLPVGDERNLRELFQILYTILYREKKQQFNWSVFREKALKHEKGQDFIWRMVNFNFKDLTSENYEKLLTIKNDPEFEHFYLNASYAMDLIGIIDWIEYVCIGHQFTEEKKHSEKQYDKIRKDLDKKEGGSLKMSENFWHQASSELDKYQNNLQLVRSQLMSIVFGLKKSVEECGDQERKIKNSVNELNGTTSDYQ